MESLAWLVLITFLSISCSESKYKLAPVVTSCPLLLPVDNYSQTVFFDMDVHAHPELKTCILKSSDQSVLLLNVYGSDLDIRLNVTRKFIRTSDNPNVMIMTRYLTPKMVDSTLLRFFIRSNWSLLYVIVTGEEKFKCENDTMTMKDFSLLESMMNSLWHRFQIMRVGVVFPFACKHKMVIYDGKRPSTGILYDRSIKLINSSHSKDISIAIQKSGEKLADDYPIKASIFRRYPTSIRDCKNLHYYVNFNFKLTNGFCGLDGMVMHDILSHLKFNLSFTNNRTCDNYGYAHPDNVSGSLGCIIRNELDISFNSRFMTMYSDDHIYYLHYIKTDDVCALLKKPDIVPLWHAVFNLFSLSLWALIGAVLMAIGGIMWTMAMINKLITGAEILTFWCYLQDSVRTTLLGYSPAKTRTLVILKSTCLLGSVFFMAVYQGHLSRVYTTLIRFRQIKTLEALYSSGATLYTSNSMIKLMKQPLDPKYKLQAEFFERAVIRPSDRLEVILQHANAVTIHRKSDANIEITRKFLDHHDTPLIDIVDECFATYYLSYITRAGFPFYKELQVISERINEAGLPKMYYKWTRQILDIADSKNELVGHPRPFLRTRLEDQRAAFVVLWVGMILSSMVFAAEIWKGRYHDSVRRLSLHWRRKKAKK